MRGLGFRVEGSRVEVWGFWVWGVRIGVYVGFRFGEGALTSSLSDFLEVKGLFDG